MKKGLIFALTLVFLLGFPIRVLAQDQNANDASPSATKEIDYTLPYPGLLPDNPLYIIKAIRDRIISFLITDPFKKAEFNLLTSDKRIYAAKMLADRGKAELSLSTLSKSNNYLNNAIGSVSEAKRLGQNVDIVLHNLSIATKKHKEVVESLLKKLDRKFSDQLRFELKRLSEFEESVSSLASK